MQTLIKHCPYLFYEQNRYKENKDMLKELKYSVLIIKGRNQKQKNKNKNKNKQTNKQKQKQKQKHNKTECV